MISGGPTDRAIDNDELAHEMAYPNDVDTLATSTMMAKATKNEPKSMRSPIMGYTMTIKRTGMSTNSGSSAIVLPRKYVSVRYRLLRCSRMNTGSSTQKTFYKNSVVVRYIDYILGTKYNKITLITENTF